MNSLYNKVSGSQTYPRNSPSGNQMEQLLNFIKTTSPSQAKAQVEQLIQEKKVSSSEFEQIKQQAQQIGHVLGFK